MHARFGGGKSKKYQSRQLVGFLSYKVHFTEACDDDAPHLIVEVTPTPATTADGDIIGELHAHLASQDLLPDQHLMDMGYVDAEVLAESRTHYQVDIVGPAMQDTCLRIKRGWAFGS